MAGLCLLNTILLVTMFVDFVFVMVLIFSTLDGGHKHDKLIFKVFIVITIIFTIMLVTVELENKIIEEINYDLQLLDDSNYLKYDVGGHCYIYKVYDGDTNNIVVCTISNSIYNVSVYESDSGEASAMFKNEIIYKDSIFEKIELQCDVEFTIPRGTLIVS